MKFNKNVMMSSSNQAFLVRILNLLGQEVGHQEIALQEARQNGVIIDGVSRSKIVKE